MSVSIYIYDECIKFGLTKEAACAILGNVQKESGFKANNLEDRANKALGLTDEQYTELVDSGDWIDFATDNGVRGGYGLFQITFPQRKERLLKFCKAYGSSIGDYKMQTAFMLWELKNFYPTVLKQLLTSHDLKELTWLFLDKYENPAEKTKNMEERYAYAQKFFDVVKNANEGATSQNQSANNSNANQTAVQKVLTLAKSEIGYHEKANNYLLDEKNANVGSGNWTKYGAELDAIPNFYNGKKNGYAWCDQFVDWLFVKCFGASAAMKMLCQPANSAGAGCMYSKQYYKNAGRFVNDPQPGDQIFFFDSSGQVNHTGIVESVNGDTIVTIEGNTSDQVARRTYSRNSGNISGYGRPRWEYATSGVTQSGATQVNVNVNVNTEVVVLRRGSKGAYVQAMQQKLIDLGYSVGPDGADGDFGENTENALIQFQKDHGLEVDGIFGSESYLAMKGGEASKPAQKKTTAVQAVTTAKKQDAGDSSLKYKVGTNVRFLSDTCYSTAGGGKPVTCKPGKAKITGLKAGAKYPYHLVRTLFGGSNVNGWVSEKDFEV